MQTHTSKKRCSFSALANIAKAAVLPLAAALILTACNSYQTEQTNAVKTNTADNPETGLQGQTLSSDKPDSILATPYSKGVNLIGHSSVFDRDSNIQMSWVGSCAYIASSMPNFLGWGVTAKPETYGVAVVDVSDPSNPKTVKFLRDKGSLASLEAMDAVDAPSHKVLAASTYEQGAKKEDQRWLSLYDVSDCANPKLMSEFRWPEKVHAVTVSPNGKRVYATHIEPFAAKGGILALDITDLSNPKYLGKFGVTRKDGSSFEFATHEISISKDETRIYAGVLGSQGHDLNHGVKPFPPSAEYLGPNGGGVYILDNSDIAHDRPNPKMLQIGVAEHGGWHSVMEANINGTPYLVGGGELGACPGAWPKFINIADESKPFLASEFKLEMNKTENCPPLTDKEKASGGIVGDVGTATLHFNDVDNETNTRLGLFNFMWAGLRVVDLHDISNPVEVAYFKPGDACTGHVRYVEESGQIWFTCSKSGFYVIELKPELRQSLGLPAI